MDFKKKFKKFVSDIREHSGKTPEEEVAPEDFSVSPAVAKFKEHLSEVNDPLAEQEVLDSIEEAYYADDNFDASQYELKKLEEDPEKIELKYVDSDVHKLRKQHQAVSRKVSELVLENHPAYAAELQRVMELQQSLQAASVICVNGRRHLSQAKHGFTTASLGVLANYRKRQQLHALLKTLRTIRTLQRTDIRLREMVEEEDYPGAIQLCLECQKAASTFRHYKCISELSSKLQDTLEMIEESLDVALSKTTSSFDEKHYEKVQTAYRLLGKTQTAMDQLHMHFTSAIHNTAFTIVLGYVELASGTGDGSFQKRQYSDLCKSITVEMFTPCLIDLCKALWEVMKSYRKTMDWHEKHDKDGSSVGSENGEGGNTMEANLNRRYIQQKLEHALGRIWGDVQHKVKIYILSTDLSYFKYDEFIQVLDIANRLIQIGEEFCGSNSEGLQDSIRKQTVNYFRYYHRARLDELRMFLENEGWELCPVKPSFSILQLQEFKFMRGMVENQKNQVEESNHQIPAQSTDSSADMNVPRKHGYFAKYGEVGSPFDLQAEDEEAEETIMDTNGFQDEGSHLQRTFSADSDSDEDVPDELKQDFVDEQTGETPPSKKLSQIRKKRAATMKSGKTAPIITNTTLNVCRLFGKYMQMMSVLKPIAFDVIICMSQLFDYYLYSVYSFFATDEELGEVNERTLSSKLRTTLRRIYDNLILADDQQDQTPGGTPDQRDKVAHPHISPIVNLRELEKLHGLAERVVATESLVFLAEQFEFLQPHLEGMIPPAKKAFLAQFYSQTVSTAQELRKPVYRTVGAKSMDHENLFNLISMVKFDQKELMSQHSDYVEEALKESELFNERLVEVGRRVPIPKAVSNVLWEHFISLANRTLVEGYASAKKCTNEGRALMQLDFQQLLIKLEKITHLRPIPDREYVEAYVKAYYLPEAQLEIWIREHKEYTTKQLIALVSCVAHINKKGRQKLINLIEELDRNRR